MQILNASSKLYLRISNEHIFFARYDAMQPNSFVWVRYNVRHNISLMLNLRNALQENPTLGEGASGVELIVCSPTTAVPFSEFQQEDCEIIYNHCFPNKGKRRIFYDTVPAVELALLFALEDPTYRALTDAFPQMHFTSNITPVLRHFSRKESKHRQRIFLYLYDQNLHLSAFDERRLLNTCHYEVMAATDVAYYALGVSRQLGIDPMEAAFYLVGDTPLCQTSLEQIKQFAKYVFTIEPASEYNHHEVTLHEEVPYDMITLLLGE